MLRFLRKDNSHNEALVFDNVSSGLKQMYREKLRPLEEAYKFGEFHSPLLGDADFDAKPMILLLGQYSTGKTTFIRYLLENDFPGIRIGPEPTTDRFVAVMHGDKDQVVPGNAAVVDPNRQFRSLSQFGNAFLSRFEVSCVNNKVLQHVSIIDTPGVLSGEKQRVDRGYDFEGIVSWFAHRVDLIILLFDAHKLDISDEFRRSIGALRGNDQKIRIVLNKADMITNQQLMRVYGALMWSLGKIIQTPEVSRVYIGSFWDRPLNNDENRDLFEKEQEDLFREIQSLPRSAAVRKVNDLIKRARLAKVHAYIIAHLRNEMPSFFGKQAKQEELIKNLKGIYTHISKTFQLPPGDFPHMQSFQDKLKDYDFTKFNKINPKLLEAADSMLTKDIAHIMQLIPTEERNDDHEMTGGVFGSGGGADGGPPKYDPFTVSGARGVNAGADSHDWIVLEFKEEYDAIFRRLGPVNGKLTGSQARTEMVKSKLPNATLRKVWNLADVDHDGMLDCDEFALAMYLIRVKLENNDLPEDLPYHLTPPSKRGLGDDLQDGDGAASGNGKPPSAPAAADDDDDVIVTTTTVAYTAPDP
ncbi:EH domain-containing protein 3-like [Sycon ciliatum]|uniref:EH domain-containing protein 3-like n=1 Tax=Sycon ciliatum TaxID=27933 RepID=UPI0020ADA6D4|eukprot:scpid39804/ scgid12348/ EH domain-containing protein 4; PAST homolog 2